MFWCDFHLHSRFSDGQLTVPELIDLFGSKGFGAIAITDHLCEKRSLLGRGARILENTLTEASFPIYQHILRSEAERAWDQYRMVVIPGFELTKNSVSNHRSAHLLGLGVNQWIDADGDPLDLARAIRAQGGLAIAAHPVSTRKIEKQTYHLWNRREELASEFDAWEVASGPRLFPDVLRSGLPMLASSDLHRRSQLTSWKTVLDCERSRDAILEAIRRQDVKFRFYQEEEGGHAVREFVDPRGLPARAGTDDLRDLVDAEAI